MQTIQVFADIQQVYGEFVANKICPKLQSLNNEGRSRFFLNQYFKLIEDWHYTEQIVIQFNQQYFSLDLEGAPDFMDQENYMRWLQSELLH
ncbi:MULTISPECIES: hypothetical protein [Acinetobacter]|uniref:Uncharacterized protein n=1 Tax=Acinetobacter pseudolwoffii TaxID=2053287 RepID=N9KNY6_9GAMM|nr:MULTISPECIES: hypothetical protein [Acinetobacter]ENW25589.1 hypothetical protein F925_00937 [Acinetobacter lwoffii NCTC 5866 = CIP 64.10 = NIPH 512]NLZ86648.1 hypothetical protein [Gammaproteobacteria bacterium]ENW85648.1 hypothetical protein F906_02466 [Acinetobacter pseudolwoffii]MDM1341984.1 hypothetical protein [Acinetobacter pseudolwoffii]MEE1122938.1 hypothetical protein [Acinetobacter pseudolwoffii]